MLNKKGAVICAISGAAFSAVIVYLMNSPVGSGQISFEGEHPNGMAFLIREMLTAYFKLPIKKSIADRLKVTLALQDIGKEDRAATATFNGSDVTIRNGVCADAGVILQLDMNLLMKLNSVGYGLEMLKFPFTEDGKEIIGALRKGKIKPRGVAKHPLQMIRFGRLLLPPREIT